MPDNRLTPTARRLRRDATDVEARLWQRLRARQIEGAKFRRQEPIGRHVADFICVEARLVVELDGGQHASAHAYDDRRTAFLERRGFRVLRFWNHAVLEGREGVCQVILAACGGEALT